LRKPLGKTVIAPKDICFYDLARLTAHSLSSEGFLIGLQFCEEGGTESGLFWKLHAFWERPRSMPQGPVRIATSNPGHFRRRQRTTSALAMIGLSAYVALTAVK